MSRSTTSTEQPIVNAQCIDNPEVHTSYDLNPGFIPPNDFEFLPTLHRVPINPKGPNEILLKTQQSYTKSDYAYKPFLPCVTFTSEPALALYEHVEAASRADPQKKALFAAMPRRRDITPHIGKVRGVQLSQLTDLQKEELALYAAECGIVVLRDQDFVHQGLEWI
jgi:sulfonate dioxygenase